MNGGLLASVLALLVTVGAHPPARTVSCAGQEERMGGARTAYVATVLRGARAYARPGGAVVRSFGNVGIDGGPQVFSVLGRVLGRTCKTEWLHVQLPVRPNGAHGYVHVFAVRLTSVRTRLFVDVARRRLTLVRNGHVLLRAPVAVGTSATPTPRGRFYVKEALLTRDPRGAYGPGALGLSSYSPVLVHWAEGGPIGIHGTDQPWSIGRAASNGCIRVHNAVARRLLRLVPLGTPVVVR
jgi:lipoprotein-anchoring transpeptidase ErfK/SrfK